MTKVLKLFLAGFLTIAITACEEDEDAAIFAAQQCLNTATAATVDTCIAGIAGQTTTEAFTLKCAADFIRAGITESEIVAAMEDVDNQGTDPTANIIQNFKFSSTAEANQAVANCTATGSTTLITLVNTARMATILTDAAGCIGAADPSTYINSYTPGTCTGTAAENLGTVLIENQSTFCGDEGLYKDSDVCTNLNAAIAANPGNAAAIADQFLQDAD